MMIISNPPLLDPRAHGGFNAGDGGPCPSFTASRIEADQRDEYPLLPVEVLRLIEASLSVQRRLVREGDCLYKQGELFTRLYVVNSGTVKLVNRLADGRERITSFRFKGDWIGMDGMRTGLHECDAWVMDTGEVWSCSYQQLITECRDRPHLLDMLLRCISQDVGQAHDHMMSVCSLATQARVAQFLCTWIEALDVRGLRTDKITLRLSREEMGAHLGMTLESVSRSLTVLRKMHLIDFVDRCRRELFVPDVRALLHFIKGRAAPSDRGGAAVRSRSALWSENDTRP